MHADWPVAEYLPASQGIQPKGEPIEENFPAEQSVHWGVVPLPSSEEVPAAHKRQEDEVASAVEYLPTSHGVQEADPVFE